jgi:hypothetical protein
VLEFGEYIVYVDESGDHSMTSIDENYPIFSLAFCVFKKADYVRIAVPAMQEFKFRWFGHDTVVMHEADIVKRRGPFHFLQYDKIRSRFMDDRGDRAHAYDGHRVCHPKGEFKAKVRAH